MDTAATASGDKDTIVQAHTVAVRLLSMREHSQKELHNKLVLRGFTEGVIATVLASLIDSHLQSDARYAENYVRMRSHKGYGPVTIVRDLQQRGIDAAIIDAAMAGADVQWQDLAARVRVKKFGAMLPNTPAQIAKQQRFLQYRGFDGADIRAVLRSD